MLKSIFVSSTFNDMQHERDAIQTMVIPALNAMACRFGDTVTACDLRWGIDTAEMTEETSARKILSVCMDEIDRCHPYMIVILGNRYGWIPDRHTLLYTIGTKPNFILNEDDISVTELEIRYGAFRQPLNAGRTLFYFREIDGSHDPIFDVEDAEHKEKLLRLKSAIQKIPGSHVRTYHMRFGEDTKQYTNRFAAMVTEDLCALLQKDWIETSELDPYQKDRRQQLGYLNQKSAQFKVHGNLVTHCMDELLTLRNHVIIHSPSGSGKSTLLSKLGYELQKIGQHIIPIYCGHTSLCNTGFDILRYLVWELERGLNSERHFTQIVSDKSDDITAWNEYFVQLLEQYNLRHGPEITFLIDGIDQLIPDDVLRELSFIPRSQSRCVHFILSTTAANIRLPYCTPITIGTLSPKDAETVICGILQQKHRELSPVVIQALTNAESAENPLYLSLMIQRLLMMNRNDFSQISAHGSGIHSINNHQLRLIAECPKDLEQLSAHIVSHAATLLGNEAMIEAAKLIAVSRHGLRPTDLEGIVKLRFPHWNTLDMATFFQYLGQLIVYRKDGRIDFSHKSIKEGFLKHCSPVAPLHRRIGQWLYSLSSTDEVRGQEAVYHLMSADMKTEYVDMCYRAMSEELFIENVVKDTVVSLMSDNGLWIIETIKEHFLSEKYPDFSTMLNTKVFFKIPNTVDGLNIKLRLSEIMYEAAQKRCAVRETHGSIWDLTVACDRLAATHLLFETVPHRNHGLKCSKHSLYVRRQLLLRYEHLKTPTDARTLLHRELLDTGKVVAGEVSDTQAMGFLQGMITETKRGLCVAYEDISDILVQGSPAEIREGLQYILESIKLREELLSNGSVHATVRTKALCELSLAYGKAFDASMASGSSQDLQQAEAFCKAAFSIAQNCRNAGEDQESALAFCKANVRYSDLYLYKGDVPRALEHCMSCVPILEKENARKHSLETMLNLAGIYCRVGECYSRMREPENRRTGDIYMRKGHQLMQEASTRYPCIETLRNIVTTSLMLMKDTTAHKPADGMFTDSHAGPEETIASTFSSAKHAAEEIGSAAAHDHLVSIYQLAKEVLQKGALPDEKDRARLLAEIDACILESSVYNSELSRDDIRSLVVKATELSDRFEKMQGLSPSILPKRTVSLLQSIEVSPDTLSRPGKNRSHDLASISLRFAKYLMSEDQSLETLDMYAVSLTKYASSCVQVSSPDTKKAHDELRHVAQYLYAKTERSKYAQILTMCEFFNMFWSKAEDSDVGEAP